MSDDCCKDDPMQERQSTLLGQATLAWQSDYGQFCLIDPGSSTYASPTEITAEMEARSLFVLKSGLVVYTSDCLQQHIEITVYDGEPAHPSTEPMSGAAWTRVEAADLTFPSRSFTISSPSRPDPMPFGPVFFVGAEAMKARIAWKAFQGGRDDSVPVEPDVIAISLWPQL